MPEPSARVVAVTATYRRPAEVARLLRSFEKSALPLRGAIVVDNAADPAVREMVERSGPTAVWLAPGANLGCGGGLAFGERAALERFGDLTHVWILDDDTVIAPDTLPALLSAMREEDALAAHPLSTDAEGRLGWFPGLLDRRKFRIIHEPQTPEQFIARCGEDPIPFSWAQSIALLVARRALEELGFHRGDYWVRGEDLEFSLRVTHRFRGIYVPRARVEHLPPPPQAADSTLGEYRKHCAMIQNIAYTGLRLPHGRRIARTLPGNCLRFARTWGLRPRVLADAAGAVWRGAVRGLPAGAAPPGQRSATPAAAGAAT